MTIARACAVFSAEQTPSAIAVPAKSQKQRVMDFVARASTEITTHDEKVLPELAATLGAGVVLYVAHTPKATFEEVIDVSLRVQSLGLTASPHLVARRLPSEQRVREGLRKLADAGIRQALLVAGDRDEPLGPYNHTLDVLDSDVLLGSGLQQLAVAGHPEGHPQATDEQLWSALRCKQEFGRQSGLSVHVATQFGFSPHGLDGWVRRFAENGIDLPVHAGVAGPTSLTKLLRFAMQCGVGASLHSAMKNFRSVSSVAAQTTTPEGMVASLVDLGAGSAQSRIVQPHFFAFGGAVATAKWMRAVKEGRFGFRPDGGLELTR